MLSPSPSSSSSSPLSPSSSSKLRTADGKSFSTSFGTRRSLWSPSVRTCSCLKASWAAERLCSPHSAMATGGDWSASSKLEAIAHLVMVWLPQLHVSPATILVNDWMVELARMVLTRRSLPTLISPERIRNVPPSPTSIPAQSKDRSGVQVWWYLEGFLSGSQLTIGHNKVLNNDTVRPGASGHLLGLEGVVADNDIPASSHNRSSRTGLWLSKLYFAR
mmetsp:Transcript_43328/g.122778  ORF Transcript_43328/g.122778 Transcript_43328/m.122778 type:complete len:219 (-) Transcript_43328:1783-2439(-)